MVKVTDENGVKVWAHYFRTKKEAAADATKAWLHVRPCWRVEVRDMRGPRGLEKLFPLKAAR